MADGKITDDPTITQPAGAVVPVVQGGGNKKVSAEMLMAGMLSILASDFTGQDANTAQPVFSSGQDAIDLEAETTYRFRAKYWITRAAGTTSHTTGVLFGGTAVLSAVDYLAQVTNPTGNNLGSTQQIQADAATLVTLTGGNTAATENVVVVLDGTIRVDQAGTLIPQFKYSAAPGGVPTIKKNSYFEIWPIGGDGVATLGPWA